MKIYYKSGYKYQLHIDIFFDLAIQLPAVIKTRYLSVTKSGELRIKAGYAWDGPSGPTIDTKNFMRGSLIHDALYQLMREGHLQKTYRQFSDRLLQRMCKEDGMSAFRSWYVYHAVNRFGASNNVREKRPVLQAP